MAFQPKRDTELLSVYDLTTRELRYEIRRRTATANRNIEQLRERDEFLSREEKMLSKVRESTYYVKRDTGEIKIPKGRKGEIGLGLTYKHKDELQEQLLQLRGFEEETSYKLDVVIRARERAEDNGYDWGDLYDLDIPDDIEFSDKVQKQYDTYVDRYGYISKDEYLDMIDAFNNLKEALKNYGYESVGGSLAAKYAEASKTGKRKFSEYVNEARGLSKDGTVEDLIDNLAELMKEDGVL